MLINVKYLYYQRKFSFTKYSKIREYNDSSFKSKYNQMTPFYSELFTFKNLAPWKKWSKAKKNIAFNSATRLNV